MAGYWRDPLANAGKQLRPILAGYSAPTGEGYSADLLASYWDTQRDTRRDPLAGCSGGILGGATLAGYSADELLWDTQRAGSTGWLLWRDTRRDPLAGGILGGIHWRATLGYSARYSCSGGIHWRAALAGYSAGSTGEQLQRENIYGRVTP